MDQRTRTSSILVVKVRRIQTTWPTTTTRTYQMYRNLVPFSAAASRSEKEKDAAQYVHAFGSNGNHGRQSPLAAMHDTYNMCVQVGILDHFVQPNPFCSVVITCYQQIAIAILLLYVRHMCFMHGGSTSRSSQLSKRSFRSTQSQIASYRIQCLVPKIKKTENYVQQNKSIDRYFQVVLSLSHKSCQLGSSYLESKRHIQNLILYDIYFSLGILISPKYSGIYQVVPAPNLIKISAAQSEYFLYRSRV